MSDNQYPFEVIRDVGYLIQDLKAQETVKIEVTNDDGRFFSASSSKGMPCGLSETSRAIEQAYKVTRNCPDPRDEQIKSLHAHIKELEEVNDAVLHAVGISGKSNKELTEALRKIAKGQEPMDYGRPVVTIERLQEIAVEALGNI